MMTLEEMTERARAVAEREFPRQVSDADLHVSIASAQSLILGALRTLTREEEDILVLDIVRQMIEGPKPRVAELPNSS